MNLLLEKLTYRSGTFSLQVEAVLSGPATALCGPSGAGKTTLVELIAGLRRPTSGRMVLGGEVLFSERTFLPAQRRRIGYVPQDLALFPHLSVEANLRYGQREGRLSLADVCEALEIGPLLARKPGTLSGGEQRRVALGRALLADPALLLLDEPLSNLDEPLKARILPHLRTVREHFGTPLLYVTHDEREVAHLCNEVVALEGGRITRHARAV